jgi:hypothetical protein
MFAQTDDIPLKEAFETLQRSKKIKFFYTYSWIENIRVDRASLNLPLPEFLKRALDKTEYSYIFYKNRNIILVRSASDSLQHQRTRLPDQVTEKNFIADGNVYTVSGRIKNANSGENIIGGSIYIEELKTGTTSNTYGYYSLSVPSGIYTFQITAIGKAGVTQRLIVNKNLSFDIELFESLTQLNEVVIVAEAMDKNISSIDIGVVNIDTKTLQSMPSFLGETDIIKSITLMPGVTTVGEGAGGFNVRGGNSDQNLILIDDVPIYNSSHLFGFFSMINTDVVKDVVLYKGGIPAQYGGRVSSVLDMKLKDGNSKVFSGNGGIGVISSRLMLEGPIIKDKLSFVVGGRYAYPNWILKRVPDYSIRNSEGNFYDANMTLNYELNKKNTLRFSSYYSTDGFKFAADTLYGWATFNSTIRWNTLISEKLFLSTSLFKSDYTYSVEGNEDPFAFKSEFGIQTLGAKIDGSYFANLANKIDFGLSSLYYNFNPGNLISREGSSLNPVSLQPEQAIESGIYINDEIKINNRITLSVGLRYSTYSSLGAQEVFIYDPSVPKSPSTIIDTLSFAKNEIVKTYSGFEPRGALKISLDSESSIKVGYNKTIQYLHLISNTAAISPLDIWKSSNYYIEPQRAQQFSLGYFRNFKKNTIETSLEIYYKEIENLVDYKDGADLFLNPFLESELLTAFGKSYGAELLVRKTYGSLTGWIGYTYSRTLRQVNGLAPSEKINGGKFFPANYDKPHDLSIVMNYKLTRRLSFSGNFTYNTGRPITYPDAVFIVDGYTVTQFSERNQDRVPDYHRLDISFILDKTLKQTQRWKGSWVLSIYNLYGRKNPYSIFFKPTNNGSLPQSYRLAVLGTVFPSIGYNFQF